MPFVKVQKNKAYFKRYQVKYRRRRQGKTDYYARKRLIVQHKAKYNTPKYRLVVRFTNRYCICQVVYSQIDCDRVLASAYSSELGRYGLKCGLKNYAAAYCTGLLVARRLLHKLSNGVSEDRQLSKLYTGDEEVTAEIKFDEGTLAETGRKHFVEEVNDDVRPFRAFLDVGLKPTTSGSKIFAALKGAVDGGLDIPHNEKRFYMDEDDGDKKIYSAESMRERLLGGGVTEYMEHVKEQDEEEGTNNFGKLFSQYVKEGLGPENYQDTLLAVHKAIRADPAPRYAESAKAREYNPDGTKKPNEARKKSLAAKPSQRNRTKISLAQRKARVSQKKVAFARKAAALMADDDDDDE